MISADKRKGKTMGRKQTREMSKIACMAGGYQTKDTKQITQTGNLIFREVLQWQ